MRAYAAIVISPLLVGILVGADAPAPTYQADVKSASDEAQRAMAKFRVPAGLKVELWAAEPMLANPVAIAFDEHGHC